MRFSVYQAQICNQICLNANLVGVLVTRKHQNLPKCFQENAEFLRSSQSKDRNKYLKK